MTEIKCIAQTMNCIDRLQRLSSNGVLTDSLHNEGHVPVNIFLEWWHSEMVFEGLQAFMKHEFGERAMLLEKSGSHSLRYRIKRTQPLISRKQSSERVKGGSKGRSS